MFIHNICRGSWLLLRSDTLKPSMTSSPWILMRLRIKLRVFAYTTSVPSADCDVPEYSGDYLTGMRLVCYNSFTEQGQMFWVTIHLRARISMAASLGVHGVHKPLEFGYTSWKGAEAGEAVDIEKSQ